MSSSARGRARKEYVFACGEDTFPQDQDQEFVSLKSDRFGTRKTYICQDDMIVPAANGQSKTSFHAHSLNGFKEGGAAASIESCAHQIQTDHDIGQWMVDCCAQSPTAQALLRVAKNLGYALSFETNLSFGYCLDRQKKVIFVDHFGLGGSALGRSSHYRNAALVSFWRGLRALFHDKTMDEHKSTLRPDAYLMMERARMADIETMAILCAWELRASGYPDVWRHILGGDAGDMAVVFTDALSKDPSGFYDGSVFTRTFCQWYGDQIRVGVCDHQCLEDMDERLQTLKNKAFGQGPVRGRDVESLSKLPHGPAYLMGMGPNICTDPYFVSMNDSINESHLFQIVYDSKVVMVAGVPFRDHVLSNLIFPTQKAKVRD